MSEQMTRFLGGSPLRVIFKLLLASLIVGFTMAYFGWSPYDVLNGIVDFVARLWNLGFDALEEVIGYVLLGAAIVVPAFFILRLLNFRR